MNIIDIQKMPGYNSSVANGADSVTAGIVTLMGGKPWCKYHGAMNSVAQSNKIWRCLACHAGAYDE